MRICVCVCVLVFRHTMHIPGAYSGQRGCWVHGTEVMVRCTPLGGCWEPNPSPLQELLLTAKPPIPLTPLSSILGRPRRCPILRTSTSTYWRILKMFLCLERITPLMNWCPNFLFSCIFWKILLLFKLFLISLSVKLGRNLHFEDWTWIWSWSLK